MVVSLEGDTIVWSRDALSGSSQKLGRVGPDYYSDGRNSKADFRVLRFLTLDPKLVNASSGTTKRTPNPEGSWPLTVRLHYAAVTLTIALIWTCLCIPGPCESLTMCPHSMVSGWPMEAVSKQQRDEQLIPSTVSIHESTSVLVGF